MARGQDSTGRTSGRAPARAQQLRMPLGDTVEGYRSTQVCRLVGITYRQLDHWARTGLVVPSLRQAHGSGTQRLYSFQDIVELRVIKQMLDAGLSHQRVREVVDQLRRSGRRLGELTVVATEGRVYAVEDTETVIDLIRQGQTVFSFALGPIVEQLTGEITAFPAEAARVEAQAAASDRSSSGQRRRGRPSGQQGDGRRAGP